MTLFRKRIHADVSLCLSNSRNEDRALFFEARNPRVGPRCVPDQRSKSWTSAVIHRTQTCSTDRLCAVIDAAGRLRRDAVVAVVQTADCHGDRYVHDLSTVVREDHEYEEQPERDRRHPRFTSGRALVTRAL